MSLSKKNPFHHPSFTLKNRLGRLCWSFVYVLLFRPSPRPLHGWRSFLLSCFGAKLGKKCHFYPKCRVWAPWNLECGNHVGVADEAEIYNPAKIVLDDYATVSQGAYLCGASHDVDDPDFPLIADEIYIGKQAWICARATVLMGVRVEDGAVLAINSLATKDLGTWVIYGGIPAHEIRKRRQNDTLLNTKQI